MHRHCCVELVVGVTARVMSSPSRLTGDGDLLLGRRGPDAGREVDDRAGLFGVLGEPELVHALSTPVSEAGWEGDQVARPPSDGFAGTRTGP